MSEVVEERYFTYVNGGAGSNNNKFYRYQLLADGTILTQWGRIGETPSNGRKTGGKTALERLIRERTGKKGYKEQEIIGSTLSAGAPAIQKEKLERIAATALVADGSASAPVSALIHRLVDLNKHEIVEASGGKIEVDTDGVVKTALGIVSQNTIARARTVLGNLTSDPTNTTLVDQYVSLIPQKVPRRSGWAETFLTDVTTPEKQSELLDQLEQSVQWYENNREAAERKAREESGKDADEADYSNLFRYRVREVAPDTAVFAGIKKKYQSEKNYHHKWSSLRPVRVFELFTPADDEAEFSGLASSLGNVKHLWHGSRAFNILSILRRGLFTPPRTGSDIPITDRMFGDGVYTSADASKSLGYSHGYWSGAREYNCFMFLADVVAGREYTPTVRHYDSGIARRARSGGFNSINVRGGYAGVKNHEQIVWNDRQVQLRYLVEFNR